MLTKGFAIVLIILGLFIGFIAISLHCFFKVVSNNPDKLDEFINDYTNEHGGTEDMVISALELLKRLLPYIGLIACLCILFSITLFII